MQCKLGGRAERTDSAAADRFHRKHANHDPGIACYALIESGDTTEQSGYAAFEHCHAAVGHGDSRGTIDRSWIDVDETRYAGKYDSTFDH